jgi:hypothetical protein
LSSITPPFPRAVVVAGEVWGVCNLAVAYTLLAHVGNFEPRRALDASAFGLGLTAMSLVLARSLGRFHGGDV